MSESFMKSVTKTETTKNSFPLRYMWSDDSAHAFQQALASNKIQSLVSEFVSTTSMNDNNSINTASAKLGNIFSQAAEMSLKKQKPRNKNKPKNPKWFNCNLQQLRQNLFSYGKVYTKYPKDPAVKNHFYKLYREYNKIRKSEKKSFRQNLLKELETLHDDNPKKYWQLINELQGTSQNQDGNCISASDWTSHFKNLNEVKEKFKDRIKEIDQNVKQLEQEHCFNELDFAMTESEIAKAIAQVKANKSPTN